MKKIRVLVMAAACASATPGVAFAGQCQEFDTVEVNATDAAAGQRFGAPLSASGTRIAVGVPSDDEIADDAGAVYVLVEQNGAWVEETKITAFDAMGFDAFGTSVALEGATLAIGATGDDDRGFATGAVYIYTLEKTGWTFRVKILGDDTEAGDQFGRDVALDAGRLAVGVARDDDIGMFAGAAYLFTGAGSEWGQEQKLTAPGGEAGDMFGSTIALDGDVFAAGAPNRDLFSVNDGSVYVFERPADADGPAWGWVATLEPTDEDSVGTGLGRAIDIDGDLIVAGGPGADVPPFDDIGMIMAAERIEGQWEIAAELNAPEPAPGANFGAAVRIAPIGAVASAGQAILVGSPNHLDYGRVNVLYRPEYHYDGWVGQAPLVGRYFGADLDAIFSFFADGSPDLRLVVGDPGFDLGKDEDVGSVSVIDLTCPLGCAGDADGDGAVGFSDVLAILAAWGNDSGPEDVDGNGNVGFSDILFVLAAWGPCA